MRTATLLRISIWLIVPVLACGIASLIIIGGIYQETAAAYRNDRFRLDELTKQMNAIDADKKREPAAPNADLARLTKAVSDLSQQVEALKAAQAARATEQNPPQANAAQPSAAKDTKKKRSSR